MTDTADADAAATEPTTTARLFLALWPDAEVRRRLIDWQDACLWPAGARPTLPQHLHLTLHFLGQTPQDRIADITDRIDVHIDRFTLTLDRAEIWSNGVAVLQPTVVPQALLDLRLRLGDVLQAMGLPVEVRPFRPHVTLARRAVGTELPSGVPAVRWDVEGHVLAESRGGYRVLDSYP
ncbi:MAG: ligT [Rhizobacter sp.]|jgi:2'-5' RNA ligase|nr:ligT [Rhizobacter sp.]